MPNLHGESRANDAANEQRRQAQRMEAFGQVAGGIAHEFNNLLMIILGNLDLCETAGRTTAERREYIAEARGAAERCAAVTRQLHTIGQRGPVDALPVDLNVVVEHAVSDLRQSLAEGVVLVSNLAVAPCPARVDAGAIQRVLRSLVTNAVEAMPDGGSVTIMTEDDPGQGATAPWPSLEPGRYVRLSVRDTGVGMSDETRRRAFEPFFTTRTPARGRGLGLTTAYATVAQMHGVITIASAPGEGTEIVILVPRTSDPIPPPSHEHDGTVMRRSL